MKKKTENPTRDSREAKPVIQLLKKSLKKLCLDGAQQKNIVHFLSVGVCLP